MKNSKIPMRRCIGCMESKPKNNLVRIAYYEGSLTTDFSGKAKGRGVYLCRNEECISTALKKNALQRNFRTNFDKEITEKIFEEIRNEQK